MNTSGFIRGLMSKNLSEGEFFKHILTCIEKELIEWGHETVILYDWNNKTRHCTITFIIDLKTFNFQLDFEIIKNLQARSPFSLDRYIWEHIVSHKIQLQEDQYIKTVFL